jgi:hypothetical protein
VPIVARVLDISRAVSMVMNGASVVGKLMQALAHHHDAGGRGASRREHGPAAVIRDPDDAAVLRHGLGRSRALPSSPIRNDDGLETPVPSFVKVWVIPLVCLAAFAAVVAFLASRYGDWSFSSTFETIMIVSLGIAARVLGTYNLYETAAKRLGCQCATGPQLGPDGRSVVGDVVIRGEIGGRPFTLSRVQSSSSGRRRVFSSTVEWTGKDIRVPSFSLRLDKATDVAIPRMTGSAEMAQAISGLLFRHESAPSVSLDSAMPLARRASVTGPDAAAVLAYLNPMRCEALDSPVATGSIQGEPGRIVLHASGFPLPWRLQAFLAHADAVRGALTG